MMLKTLPGSVSAQATQYALYIEQMNAWCRKLAAAPKSYILQKVATSYYRSGLALDRPSPSKNNLDLRYIPNEVLSSCCCSFLI